MCVRRRAHRSHKSLTDILCTLLPYYFGNLSSSVLICLYTSPSGSSILQTTTAMNHQGNIYPLSVVTYTGVQETGTLFDVTFERTPVFL